MMFAKFEGSEAQPVGELALYVNAVMAEIQFELPVDVEDNTVKVLFETQRDMKQFMRRILQDFETLGYEIEQDVNLCETTVYFSDAEINSAFINQRINIQTASSIALSEIIVEVDNANAHLERRIETMETSATLNGTYKMRAILGVIVDALDEKGIFIAERINKVSLETVH